MQIRFQGITLLDGNTRRVNERAMGLSREHDPLVTGVCRQNGKNTSTAKYIYGPDAREFYTQYFNLNYPKDLPDAEFSRRLATEPALQTVEPNDYKSMLDFYVDERVRAGSDIKGEPIVPERF
jgi:hypothetical protein